MKDLESEFERMVRENRSTIYTVCYMFSNDQDEVADLFQEVLINLWKSLPSFEERGDVRSWIYRVSLNVCISLDRKKRRNKTVPLTMDIDPYEEAETNQNSHQMEMLRQRIARHLPLNAIASFLRPVGSKRQSRAPERHSQDHQHDPKGYHFRQGLATDFTKQQ